LFTINFIVLELLLKNVKVMYTLLRAQTQLHPASQDSLFPRHKTHNMSTSFIEKTSHTRIELHNRLLDTQNELQGKIQQLIKNYGKDSADRRHRDGYYSGKLNQLNDLWQQFCDVDEEVQQVALPTGSEYCSRVVALKELVEKYQNIFLDNMPTESGLPKAPRRTSANIKITTRDQVKEDSTIDTVIRQLQRRCNELESPLGVAEASPR